PLSTASGICGIAEYSHSLHAGCDLLEQLQPFCPEPILEYSKSCRVTAWSCKAFDEPSANRIGNLREHNRYSPTFLLQRVCSLARNRQREVGCKCNQFGCVFANDVGTACPPAVVDPYILPFGPPQFFQPLKDRRFTSLTFGVVCD